MKSSIFALAGLLLLSALLFPLTACGTSPSPSDPSSPAIGTSELTAPETAYDPSLYVVIRTAEDLMAFNRAVNRDEYRFDGMTVIFLSDVDMQGYTWTPLDGARLVGVTFDGQGHTIENLTPADHEYPVDAEPDNREKGCGLVDVAEGDMIFRDLTIAHARVSAYDHSVGCFVGAIYGGRVTFEQCRAVDFRAEGWMDWFDRDREQGGHAVAMRMGGFVGYVGEGGGVSFDACAVEDLTLSGFHNLAGFVGYDASGTLDAADFTDCAVKGAAITFAYCLAENYTVDQPKKFVSVFYNAADWVDGLDACTSRGNVFEDVIYYDYANDSTAYTPTDFRSWSREEAESHG